MRVTVLYFGMLKDVFGTDRVSVELGEGETVAGLVSLCRENASKGCGSSTEDVWKAIAVAVNQEYAMAGQVLCEGDEVALLPPVSGGAR